MKIMKNAKIVAEIGINHNGDINIAKSLASLAKNFGADYIKLQKKNPDICVPENEKNIEKPTIFGPMKYIDYKKRMEFNEEKYNEFDRYCTLNDIPWFTSVWDVTSVNFIDKYNPDFIKIPSACITDKSLLTVSKDTNIPIIISRGMSTKEELDIAIEILGDNLKYILHTTSSYPCPNEEMNMNALKTLKDIYGYKYKIGFSNHCSDIIYIIQAYVMGAEMLEFHITLDRNMGGTDQIASIGPTGFKRIIDHLKNIDKGFGDGMLEVQKSEYPIREKLRKL